MEQQINATPIQQLLSDESKHNQTVKVQGWVRTRRDSKAGFSFINVNDGSHLNGIQIIAPHSLDNYESDVLKLSTGCSIEAIGTLTPSPGQKQSVEIKADSITVVGWVDDPETYPISPKRHSLEYLRSQAHLRPRTNTISAMTRIRHHLAHAIHQFFHQRGFYWITTPIITTSDCEGAGELFKVSTLDLVNRTDNNDWSEDFFGEPTYLTVSGQLNVETYCQAMSKVYTFSPAFRSENSNTSRHLAEFWMVEPEIAFADLEDSAQLAEDLLKHCLQTLLAECPTDMAFFEEHYDSTSISKMQHIIDQPFIRLDYTQAIEHLKQADQTFEFPVEWGYDLQSEHERYLTETVYQQPVVIINYPKTIKAFYMRVNDDQETVAAMDVIVPGIGEIIGGSQREERLDYLDARMAETGIDKAQYWWYRDLRRYGTVPHAGFGLGLERLLSYVTGLHNVRDVIPFPRTPRNAEF